MVSSGDGSRRNSASSDFSLTTHHLEFTEFSRFECWKYIVFLVIFTTMSVLGRGLGSKNYYVSDQVSKQFTEQYYVGRFTEGEKSLMDVDQYFEIYDWLTQVSIPILLVDESESTQEITNTSKLNLVTGQNKVVGAIRIRQLRVKQEECEHPQADWTCYPPWSS
eukprot:821611_1